MTDIIVCMHRNEEHVCGEDSSSSGDTYWCPDCGALSIVSQWDEEWENAPDDYREWKLPTGRPTP